MTQSFDPSAPAIGACLNCRNLFLVLPETPNCLMCGRPPAYTLPFLIVHPEPVEGAPPEPVESTLPSAPPEDLPPAAADSSPVAGEEAPEDVQPGLLPGPLGLHRVIQEYLVEGVEETLDVRQALSRFGAEEEEVDSAVDHLIALRDLIDKLWERYESEPVEPMAPQTEGPDEEA